MQVGTVIAWEDVLAGVPLDSPRLPMPSVGPLLRNRTEACICGGYVHADPIEPSQGVAAHNRSKLHREWRAKREHAEKCPARDCMTLTGGVLCRFHDRDQAA